MKNKDTKSRITAGGVRAKGGKMRTLLETGENIAAWGKLEFDVEVPEKMWLSFH